MYATDHLVVATMMRSKEADNMTTKDTCWGSSCAPPALASSPGAPGAFPSTEGSLAVESRNSTLDDSFFSSSVSLADAHRGGRGSGVVGVVGVVGRGSLLTALLFAT